MISQQTVFNFPIKQACHKASNKKNAQYLFIMAFTSDIYEKQNILKSFEVRYRYRTQVRYRYRIALVSVILYYIVPYRTDVRYGNATFYKTILDT